MMRIQTGEHYLNASGILQVNATILAGVLIFVTIASAASAKTSISYYLLRTNPLIVSKMIHKRPTP